MRQVRLMVGVATATLLLAMSTGSAAVAASGGTGGTLEGPTWVLKSYALAGVMTDVPATVYADAVFTSGSVNGTAGCNVFGGSYTASGATLTFGPLVTTMMACGAPADGVEAAYLAALGKAATYTATADALTIYDATGAELLAYEAGSATVITGTTWHLRAYNNSKQAVVSVLVGTDPTAAFGTDGTVSGNATCNQYNGPYSTSAATIKIGPLASTFMACASTVEADQEAQFLAALQKAATFQVKGRNLEMRDASGAIQAEFAAIATEPTPTTAPPTAEPTAVAPGTPQPTAPPTSTSGGAQGGGLSLGIVLLVAGVFLATILVDRRRTLRDR